MPDSNYDELLTAVLDSWDRNNEVLLGLLSVLPPEALNVRAVAAGPSVAELFAHIDYVRLVFVEEDAAEFARAVPAREWEGESDAGRIAQRLRESAAVVRAAVEGRLRAGRAMDVHYDHPILLLQHMIWHEGYHHGQVKLALKLAGLPVADAIAGPVTWRLWMQKRGSGGNAQ